MNEIQPSSIIVSTPAVTPTVQLTDVDEQFWQSLEFQDERRNQEPDMRQKLGNPTYMYYIWFYIIPIVLASYSKKTSFTKS